MLSLCCLFCAVCLPQTSHQAQQDSENVKNSSQGLERHSLLGHPHQAKMELLELRGKKYKSREFYQVSGGQTAQSLCHAQSPGTQRCRSRTPMTPVESGNQWIIQHFPGFNTQLISAPSKHIHLMQFPRKSWHF